MDNIMQYTNHKLAFALGVVGAAMAAPLMAHNPLVDVATEVPGAVIEMRYTTPHNITGQAVYPKAKCYVRGPVAQHLKGVQEELRSQGIGLKIWDAYRPQTLQEKLWHMVQNEHMVDHPANGSSNVRGTAVACTLVNADGQELPMPTGFDEYNERTTPDFAALSPEVLQHRSVLQEVMTRHGFSLHPTKWWHFDVVGWEQATVLDTPFDDLCVCCHH